MTFPDWANREDLAAKRFSGEELVRLLCDGCKVGRPLRWQPLRGLAGRFEHKHSEYEHSDGDCWSECRASEIWEQFAPAALWVSVNLSVFRGTGDKTLATSQPQCFRVGSIYGEDGLSVRALLKAVESLRGTLSAGEEMWRALDMVHKDIVKATGRSSVVVEPSPRPEADAEHAHLYAELTEVIRECPLYLPGAPAYTDIVRDLIRRAREHEKCQR